MPKAVHHAVVRVPEALLTIPHNPSEPSIQIAVYRFYNFFSGHRRVGDLGDNLTGLFFEQNCVVFVENIDVGFGMQFDLVEKCVVDRLATLIQSGTVDGAHAGPPCASWSGERFKRPGPPPLRTRTYPWGLPASQLSTKNRKKVEVANCLLMAGIIMLETISETGGSWTLEHPGDPGRPPFPSIWALERLRQLGVQEGVKTISFPQCSFGLAAQKMTTLMGRVSSFCPFDLPCRRQRHEQELCGLDESGAFRTHIAQAYQSSMCLALAKCHAEFMLGRGPVGGATIMSESALRVARNQAARNRADLAALGDPDVLPAGFLAVNG